MTRTSDATERSPLAFLLMPFAPRFDSLHRTLVQAGQRVGIRVERADDISRAGSVLEQVLERIEGADLVIAVTTGLNPNVFLELGSALKNHNPVLVASAVDDLPFDIGHLRAVLYEGLPVDEIIGRVSRAMTETLADPTKGIERLFRLGEVSEPIGLDDKRAREAVEYARNPLRPPFLRRRCVDALAAWCSNPGTSTSRREHLQDVGRQLQRDPDIDLAKSAVKLSRVLAQHGVGDSRDIRNAVLSPAWEVRTEAVMAITDLGDDYTFRTLEGVRLSYHIPLRRLARHVVQRAGTLTEAESKAAKRILVLLASGDRVSDKTHETLNDAIATLRN